MSVGMPMPRLTKKPSRSSRAMRLTMRSRFSRSFASLAGVDMSRFRLGLRPAGRARRPPAAELLGFPYGSPLDPPFVRLALEDAFHIDARGVNRIRCQVADFDQMFDFGNGDSRGSRHHGVEVARGFPIHEVAPPVALPGFHQREIGLQSAFHDVHASIELTGLLPFGHHGADACRSKE